MNSILVIQLKRLGDVILTTPALSELRKLYPGGEDYPLVGPRFGGNRSCHPGRE